MSAFRGSTVLHYSTKCRIITILNSIITFAMPPHALSVVSSNASYINILANFASKDLTERKERVSYNYDRIDVSRNDPLIVRRQTATLHPILVLSKVANLTLRFSVPNLEEENIG